MSIEDLTTQIAQANEEFKIGNYDLAEQLANEVLTELAPNQILTHSEGEGKDGITQGQSALRSRALITLANCAKLKGDFHRALDLVRSALDIAEHNHLPDIKATCQNICGNIYVSLDNYALGLEYYVQALATLDELNDKFQVAQVMGNIGGVYGYLGNFDQALEYMERALQAHEELGKKSDAAMDMGNIGGVYFFLGKYDKALEYLERALAMYEELGEKSPIADTTGNIGSVYLYLGNLTQAFDYFSRSLATHEELREKLAIAQVTGNIGSVYANLQFEGYDEKKAEEYFLKTIAMSAEIDSKRIQYEFHRSLSALYERQKRWEESQIHFKHYHELYLEVQNEESTKQALLMEHRRKIEDSERDRQIKLARFQEQEKILQNILPAQIADRMIDGEKMIADRHENVSVFFSDIVGFTKLSQRVSAEELVGMLNGIFTQFDQLARKHGLEKIKTIGDAYMAVCGAPIRVDNHAERTALFALDVAELMNNYQTNTGDKVMIRIGLHSGSVVAGIIGENKFAYDMWGDAVNTASRMESHGEAGKIHVSQEFLKKLLMVNGEWLMDEADDLSSFTINNLPLTIIPRGEMDIKGKGKMKTYFLQKATL